MVSLTQRASAPAGGVVLHLPPAFATLPPLRGGDLVTNHTSSLSVHFDLYLGSGDDEDDEEAGLATAAPPQSPVRPLRGLIASDRAREPPQPGLSFCYGEVPLSAPLGDFGAASGLCITFRRIDPHSNQTLVEAWYDGAPIEAERAEENVPYATSPECDGATLAEGGGTPLYQPAQCEPPPAPPPPLLATTFALQRDTWHSVVVEFTPRGLSVRLEGTTLFERVVLPAWAPAAHWGFSFGARSDGSRATHRIARVSVQRGAAFEAAHVGLGYSVNGQQYAPAGHFAYHAHPIVSELAPTNGPAAGGTALTFFGNSLTPAPNSTVTYRCRFALGLDTPMFTDGRFDNELGAVLCASPSRAAMDFHTREGSPDLRARYVPTASVSPTFAVDLLVERDGVEYLPHSSSSFRLNRMPSVHVARPASGPVHGGTDIYLLGHSLSGGWRYSCQFMPTEPTDATSGTAANNATGITESIRERTARGSYVADVQGGSVRCISPHSPRVLRSPQHADYDAYGALHTELRVSLNGADYEENASTPFEFYHPPGGFSLSPNTGPSQGGISVHISGGNLTGGSDRRCRFVPVIFGAFSREVHRAAWARRVEVAGSVLPGGRLNCVTPTLPERVAQVTVEVALNGQQFTSEGARYNVTPPLRPAVHLRRRALQCDAAPGHAAARDALARSVGRMGRARRAPLVPAVRSQPVRADVRGARALGRGRGRGRGRVKDWGGELPSPELKYITFG